MITVTQHELNEWARMGAAARVAGHHAIADRLTEAASLPVFSRIPPADFEALHGPYRRWLNHDEYVYAFAHAGETWFAIFKGYNLRHVEDIAGEPVTIGDMSAEMLDAADACRK